MVERAQIVLGGWRGPASAAEIGRLLGVFDENARSTSLQSRRAYEAGRDRPPLPDLPRSGKPADPFPGDGSARG